VFLQKPSFWLVWLYDGVNNDLVGLDFIKQHWKLISLQTMEDDEVYYFGGSIK